MLLMKFKCVEMIFFISFYLHWKYNGMLGGETGAGEW